MKSTEVLSGGQTTMRQYYCLSCLIFLSQVPAAILLHIECKLYSVAKDSDKDHSFVRY